METHMSNLIDPRSAGITFAAAGSAAQMPGSVAPQQAQSRYILPSFIEHSSFGVKESNPYNKLFEERIIFLGATVDDTSANDIMAQLLVLESLDPDRDITMYINSPGGSFTALMAIYDTMQYVRADVATVCLGQAASAAAVLLAAGAPGKRACLPNARVLIHQPSTSGGIQGQVSDLEIQAAEIERMRRLMETTLARHTGKDADTIRKDTDRDKILTADEAKEYGIIDTVFEYRKLSAQK
ncbi:ATP-dependent CLP protease proteolytic subunit ClpP2 [Nocardia sp. IFM 10818]